MQKSSFKSLFLSRDKEWHSICLDIMRSLRKIFDVLTAKRKNEKTIIGMALAATGTDNACYSPEGPN